jgi:hypothetical protein
MSGLEPRVCKRPSVSFSVNVPLPVLFNVGSEKEQLGGMESGDRALR